MRFDLPRGESKIESRCEREGQRWGGDALGRDPAAPGEHVQRDPLAEEEVPRLAPDGRDVLHRLERLALLHVPFHPI